MITVFRKLPIGLANYVNKYYRSLNIYNKRSSISQEVVNEQISEMTKSWHENNQFARNALGGYRVGVSTELYIWRTTLQSYTNLLGHTSKNPKFLKRMPISLHNHPLPPPTTMLIKMESLWRLLRYFLQEHCIRGAGNMTM